MDSINRRTFRLHFPAIAVAYFLGLTLVAFNDLLWNARLIISSDSGDMNLNYPARAFAFGQIRAGHFPLWNPYIFGGMPALGNFQMAMLYPPNWMHLFLPMNLAINVTVALHFMLAGVLASAWCRYRGASIVASLLGGTIFIFGGAFALRIFVGHLAYLCSAAWTPAIFLCIDAILDRRRAGLAILGGAGAVAMQILGGHPQAPYCAGVVALIYALLRLPGIDGKAAVVLRIAGMYLLGMALSAAQLLPGLDAATEAVRSGERSYEFITSFSLPPENLLTLIVPDVFGNNFDAPYLGRWLHWETTIFVGAVASTLALLAIVRDRSQRNFALLISMLVALVLAMGRYTPLCHLLMKIVPGLDLFRAPARFNLPAMLIVSALAARGFDLLRERRSSLNLIFPVAMAIILAGFGWWIVSTAQQPAAGLWGDVLVAMSQQSNGKHLAGLSELDLLNSARFTSKQMLVTAGIFAQIAIALSISLRWRWVIYLLPLIALTELWFGTDRAWARCRPEVSAPPEWESVIQSKSPDDRILTLGRGRQDLCMQLGLENIGGYDSSAPRRWATLAGSISGDIPVLADFSAKIPKPSALWSLLRLGGTVPNHLDLSPAPPMGRVNLLDDYRVVRDADGSLQAVSEPSFDPRKQVVLEQPPDPVPQHDDTPIGQARVVQMTTDSLEIVADLSRPAILLVTDGYAKDWRVRAIDPGPQASYRVQPADHALRAVALSAGKHHFVMEYRPITFPIGLTISTLAWIGCASGVMYLMFKRARD